MRIFSLLLLALLTACGTPEKVAAPEEGPTPTGQRELQIIVAFLQGTWDAPAQPGFGPWRLRMVEFRAGTPNDRWIYAEYADPATERPTRQRVYRFSERGQKIYGVVYALREPAKHAGEWRKATPFAAVPDSAFVEQPNCRLVFERRHEALFAGGTEGNRCASDVPGVAYERSEFFLSSATLRHAYQGFDAAGRRVAGAPQPWEFRKTGRAAR